jgi:F1F0 ATPase subunit 2
MIEAPALVLMLLAGVVLGAIFFGGLWWTVRLGISSKWAAVWFLGSLLLRTGITLGGFYFVSQGDWRKVMACLVGFLVARFFVTLLTRVPEERNRIIREAQRVRRGLADGSGTVSRRTPFFTISTKGAL